MLSPMPRQLPRRMPLAELHCHLGSAVTPAIMWGIAHEQGIKLPTKDYWQFRQMITASPRRGHSFDGYLQLFHWTELIQSSPLAMERSVYEVIGGAYRKNNITTMELRFNPMKRNRAASRIWTTSSPRLCAAWIAPRSSIRSSRGSSSASIAPSRSI